MGFQLYFNNRNIRKFAEHINWTVKKRFRYNFFTFPVRTTLQKEEKKVEKLQVGNLTFVTKNVVKKGGFEFVSFCFVFLLLFYLSSSKFNKTDKQKAIIDFTFITSYWLFAWDHWVERLKLVWMLIRTEYQY